MADLEFLVRVKRLAIVALFSDDELFDRLVLKGGNLLDMVYEVSTRASVDVDFSTPGEFDLADLRLRVSRALTSTFQENDLVVFDITIEEKPEKVSPEMKSFWGGYNVFFKVIGRDAYARLSTNTEDLRRNAAVVGKRGSTRFSIQISKFECCEPKDQRMLDGYTIYCYSPRLFVCEKLRAICQQMPEYKQIVHNHGSARARDFVDIHTAVEHFGISFAESDFQQTIVNVFAAKRVPLRLIGEIAETRDFHQVDFPAVKDTVKANVTLQEFDFYFDSLLARCRSLEPLWNE